MSRPTRVHTGHTPTTAESELVERQARELRLAAVLEHDGGTRPDVAERVARHRANAATFAAELRRLEAAR